MKRGFLLLLLLCWPFVPAVAAASSITEDIEHAKDINEASTGLRTALNNLIEEGMPYATASAEDKSMAEEQIENAITKAEQEAEKPCPEQPAETPADESKQCPEGATGDYETGCTCTDEDKIYNKEQNACVEDELKKKQKAYDEAKANEQSLANRTLTAITTAATGIGGKELAQGLAEQTADANATASMDAYLATFRCTYGNGYQVKGGPDEIELPGANNQNLMNLRAQYIALAADLKERKAALDMAPGIESEVILDKSEMGLYDDENIGITGGAYESLYRAKMLNSETDQTKIDEQKDASKKRVIAGGVLVGAGTVIGVAGNMLINSDSIKEKIKKSKTNRETQKKLKKAKEQTSLKNTEVEEEEKILPIIQENETIEKSAIIIDESFNQVISHESNDSCWSNYYDEDDFEKDNIYCNINDLKKGEWLANFSYGTVKGQASCNDINGNNYDGDYSKAENANTDNFTKRSDKFSTTSTGKHCWCQTTNIENTSSDWIFENSYENKKECAENCAIDCALSFGDDLEFSKEIFNSI